LTARSRNLTVAEIVRRRLAATFLSTPGPTSAAELVGAFGAVQSQDYGGAMWALGQRLRGSSERVLSHDFDAGRILRTHVLRPTWHFVTPRDIRWMLGLTAPRIKRILASYERKLGLTGTVLRRAHAAIGRALENGAHLTRAELSQALTRARVGPAKGQRLAHMMAHAELDALVCSGRRRGKEHTYALLDSRAPDATALTREESLRELGSRYFSTRGPATVHDFSWWSGLTVGDARRAVAMLDDRLVSATFDGRDMYFFDGDAPRIPRIPRAAQLLPNYDEYFIGYKDRSAIGRRMANLDKVSGGTALIAHVVFISGDLVGGWKRTPREKGAISLDLVTRVTAAERKLIASALRRLNTFFGR
jgi:hypothetical protein